MRYVQSCSQLLVRPLSQTSAVPFTGRCSSYIFNQPSKRRAIILSIFSFSASAILIDEYHNKYGKPLKVKD